MSELSNPYAARPAFAVGDRVELWDDKKWDMGTVKRVYRSVDGMGNAVWLYDVVLDAAPTLNLPVAFARKAQP